MSIVNVYMDTSNLHKYIGKSEGHNMNDSLQTSSTYLSKCLCEIHNLFIRLVFVLTKKYIITIAMIYIIQDDCFSFRHIITAQVKHEDIFKF